jgi:hypothetical protein
LLEVAITRYSDFPLFTRRYPAQFAELAFDLFLGKPAFLVEHHGFFRNGCDALATTVARLRRIEPAIKWMSPAAACRRACLRRVAEDRVTEVKFFTDRFTLQNDSAARQTVRLVRFASSGGSVNSVLIDDKSVDLQRNANGIRMECSVEAGGQAGVNIEFARERDAGGLARPVARSYQAKVFVRRILSEFRDNYLDRARSLKRGAVASPGSNVGLGA